MPNWNQILKEVQSAKRAANEAFDKVRRKYLARLYKHTKRNIIVYYSGWHQKEELSRQGFAGFSLDDADKNGFMAVIHQHKTDESLPSQGHFALISLTGLNELNVNKGYSEGDGALTMTLPDRPLTATL